MKNYNKTLSLTFIAFFLIGSLIAQPNSQLDTAYIKALDLRARKAFYEGNFEKNILLTDSLAQAYAAGGDFQGYTKFNLFNGWTNFNELKDYDKAIYHAETALNTVNGKLNGQFPFIHDVFGLFAGVYLQIGNPEKALEYNFLSLKKIEEQGARGSFSDYDVNSNIGITYLAMEDWQEALTFFEKARTIFLKLMETNGWESNYRNYFRAAQLQAHIANCYLGMRQSKKALEESLLGLPYTEKEALPGVPEAVKARGGHIFAFQDLYFSLANSYSLNGQFQQADEYFRILENIYAEYFSPQSTQMALVFKDKADHAERKNELMKALDFNQRAMEIIGFRSTSNGFSVEKVATESNCASCEPAFFNQRIRLLYKLSQKNQNRDYLLACLENTYQALESLKRTRQTLLFREGSKQRLFEQFQAIIKRGSLTAQNLYEVTNEKTYLAQAFELAEQSKANVLLEALVSSRVEKYVDLPVEILEKERQLSLNLVRQERRLEEARMDKDALQVANIQNGPLFESKAEYESFLQQLRKDYPRYFSARHQESLPAMEDLQQALKASELFVFYVLSEEDGALQIFVTDHMQTKVFDVPWKTEYTQIIESYYRSLQQTSLVQTRKRQLFIEQSHQLYQILLQPISEYLKEKSRLIISADELLNYLPFETLLTSNADASFSELDFLVKSKAISYHYSGTVFLESRQLKVETSKKLLAFAPVFQTDDQKANLNSSTRSLIDLNLSAIKGGRFSPLPWSEKEVMGISEFFDEEEITVLVRQAASEANLKKAMEEGYRYLHLASHSFANKNNARFSGVACNQQGASNTSEDGILFINEIYNQTVNADLVVLSSCESGIGQLVAGEGMLGINRSFIYSGVPNVLYSLWKVDDQKSSELMITFYEALNEGRTYPEALRAAKLVFLKEPQTALPYYWSAFTLIGR